MPVTMHPYRGPADVRAMQLLVQREWRRASTHHHIGSFLWERVEQWQPSEQWPTMLWRDGDDVVAWGWFYERDPDVLYFEYDRTRPDLLAAVLDWFERTANAAQLVISIRADRSDLIAALESRGYDLASDETPFGIMHTHDL